MKAIRIVMLLGALVMAGLPGRSMAMDSEAARKTVETAVTEGLGSFVGKSLPLAERSRLLSGLLGRYSDPQMLAASILGRYWGRLGTDEQARFAETFHRYLVSSYVGLMKNLDPQLTVKVTGAADLGDRVRVSSFANLPSQPGKPISVDWDVLANGQGRLVIMDVTADGVSIIRAMRDDFASVMRSSGGKIEPLMEALARKIEDNNRANSE